MHIPLIDSYVTLVRKNRNYRFLWLSQVVSLMGDWFNLIASAALVANLSGSGMAIGGLFLARLLPPFVLGPLVGVVADRFDRRHILIVSDLLRAIVVLGFLWVRTEQDIWLLYGLTILQLSFSAFFEPTRAALMPSLVERKDLIVANTLDGVTWSMMLALGAALGGITAMLFGVVTAFLIDVLTFLVSAWFVYRIQPVQTRTDSSLLHIQEQSVGWQAFKEGLYYLRQHPPILILALLKASAALAYGGVAVVEVAFAKEIFPIGNDGSGTLGLIYFVIGLGTGLGPLLARRLTGDVPHSMKWAILFAYIFMMVGYLMLGWTTSLILLLIATFIRTVGSGINWVYSSALLQMIVPDRYLGRVFAFDFAMMTLTSSISTLWVGWATDQWGFMPQDNALVLGLVPLGMVLGWGFYLKQSKWALPST